MSLAMTVFGIVCKSTGNIVSNDKVKAISKDGG